MTQQLSALQALGAGAAFSAAGLAAAQPGLATAFGAAGALPMHNPLQIQFQQPFGAAAAGAALGSAVPVAGFQQPFLGLSAVLPFQSLQQHPLYAYGGGLAAAAGAGAGAGAAAAPAVFAQLAAQAAQVASASRPAAQQLLRPAAAAAAAAPRTTISHTAAAASLRKAALLLLWD